MAGRACVRKEGLELDEQKEEEIGHVHEVTVDPQDTTGNIHERVDELRFEPSCSNRATITRKQHAFPREDNSVRGKVKQQIDRRCLHLRRLTCCCKAWSGCASKILSWCHISDDSSRQSRASVCISHGTC